MIRKPSRLLCCTPAAPAMRMICLSAAEGRRAARQNGAQSLARWGYRCTGVSPGTARQHASAPGLVPDDTPRQKRACASPCLYRYRTRYRGRDSDHHAGRRDRAYRLIRARFVAASRPRKPAQRAREKGGDCWRSQASTLVLPSVRPCRWQPERRTGPDGHETLRAVRVRAPVPVGCVSPLHPGPAAGARYGVRALPPCDVGVSRRCKSERAPVRLRSAAKTCSGSSWA